MRFWFTRNGGVAIREQLVTQVILGILCDELAPEQRLPSTRDLARRFRLHSNTVSAAYRQLEKERWVEFRHGSGVYVRKKKPGIADTSALALDQLIAKLFRSSRDIGVSMAVVNARLRQWLTMQAPDHFLLLEPDEELRRIVMEEMRRAVTLRVEGAGLEAVTSVERLHGTVPVALANKREIVQSALPAGTDLLVLSVSSVPDSLSKYLPAPADTLIGIASGWEGFLKLARTMLAAAGFHSDGMVFRDTRKADWQRGLKQMAAVICDSVTAAEMPKGIRVISFPLISEAAIAELRRCEQFIVDPVKTGM